MRLTNNPRRQTFALHAGALCRAILGFRPHREIDQILQARKRNRFTPNTPSPRRG